MLYYHSSSSRSSSSSISSSISFIFQNCLVMDIFTIESKAICDPYRKLTTSHNQLFCFVFRIRFSLNYSKFAFLNDQLHVERRMQKQHTEWMSTILIRDDNKSDCGLIEISRVNLSSAHPLQLFAYVLFFFSTLLLLPLSLSLLRTHSLTHSLHCSVVIQLSAPFIIPPLSPAQNYYFFDVLLVENKSISLAINLSSRMGSHTWVVGGNHIFPQVAGVRVRARASGVHAHRPAHCRCDAWSTEAPGESGMQDERRSDAH